MADFIVLTPPQANAMRGNTVPGHALDPIELTNGTFCLPLAVLADAAHLPRRATLNAFTKRDVPAAELKWRGLPNAHP